MSRDDLPVPPRIGARTARIAVVQTAPRPGERAANVARLRDLVGSAVREHAPELIVLPERLTDSVLARGAVERADGESHALLLELARETGCLVAGGYAAATGADVRLRYVLAEPSGATHVHDKDRPDPWEAQEVGIGDGDNFWLTPLGPVGVACGLEWGRTVTAQRLAGHVALLLGGAGLASSAAAPRLLGRGHAHHAAIARDLAPRLARAVGAAAAFACQVEGPSPRSSGGRGWAAASLVGESRIVDHEGRVLARLAAADGDGHAGAEVQVAKHTPQDAIPEGPWMTLLPASSRLAGAVLGAAAHHAYARRRRRVELPWQDRPIPEMLPYNPPRDQGAPPPAGERAGDPGRAADGAQQGTSAVSETAGSTA